MSVYDELGANLIEQLWFRDEGFNMLQQRQYPDRPRLTTMAGLVLKHGVARYCRTKRLPDGLKKKQIKQCFSNCADTLLHYSRRFIYCEGFAVRGGLGLVVGEHAWLLDGQNDFAVVDLTWRHCAPGAYIGIPFSREYVFKTLWETRCYGLLDNPKRWGQPWWNEGGFLHNDAGAIPNEFSKVTWA